MPQSGMTVTFIGSQRSKISIFLCCIVGSLCQWDTSLTSSQPWGGVAAFSSFSVLGTHHSRQEHKNHDNVDLLSPYPCDGETCLFAQRQIYDGANKNNVKGLSQVGRSRRVHYAATETATVVEHAEVTASSSSSSSSSLHEKDISRREAKEEEGIDPVVVDRTEAGKSDIGRSSKAKRNPTTAAVRLLARRQRKEMKASQRRDKRKNSHDSNKNNNRLGHATVHAIKAAEKLAKAVSTMNSKTETSAPRHPYSSSALIKGTVRTAAAVAAAKAKSTAKPNDRRIKPTIEKMIEQQTLMRTQIAAAITSTKATTAAMPTTNSIATVSGPPSLIHYVGTAAAPPLPDASLLQIQQQQQQQQQTNTNISMGLLGDRILSSDIGTSPQQSKVVSSSNLLQLNPGTTLIHSAASNNNHKVDNYYNRVCEDITVRVATFLDDSTIASLRLSVFSNVYFSVDNNDASVDNRNDFFHQRSCEVLRARRNRGATCLVASVPLNKKSSLQAASQALSFIRKKKQSRQRPLKNKEDDEQEWIMGSIECSMHEFYSTRLGESRNPGKILYMTEVAVSPDARRSGVGSKLLQGADELAKRCGAETMYLHVDVTNQSALRLYKKAGYKRVNPHAYYDEFTRSLNLQDGATKGRCHYLLYKNFRPPTLSEAQIAKHQARREKKRVVMEDATQEEAVMASKRGIASKTATMAISENSNGKENKAKLGFDINELCG
eukprot:CAMPEP_0195511540 /NCGR_PEP_ID=MMETSP0794_2-20130614/3825_1 /TAXON_ID=515487 /ORGANISM="Stephanopyxis turris, Strain CCMP 815" /LENGTH=718 /DNA_ID=CAMNT_0040639161 /DNA_START=233 /DNA_END=2389 /DNA_ORIENTATION=+